MAFEKLCQCFRKKNLLGSTNSHWQGKHGGLPTFILLTMLFCLSMSYHQQCLHVSYSSCNHLYVIRTSLASHQTSCTTHMQSLASKVSMFSTLSSSPPSTQTWITTLDIIDDFHLGLPCPHSYHHIPYVLLVKVQHTLHILLTRLVVNPSNIATWHAFLLFHMVRPVYITSSKFSCTSVQFLYSRCSNGFFAICGVLRIKGILKGPQHNHEPFYVCKPLGSFYNAFTLLCPTARLFTMYYISITMYLAMLY